MPDTGPDRPWETEDPVVDSERVRAKASERARVLDSAPDRVSGSEPGVLAQAVASALRRQHPA
jgi:hypothetical protein